MKKITLKTLLFFFTFFISGLTLYAQITGPEDAIICNGEDAVFTVEVVSSTPPTYQWQVKIEGGDWEDLVEDETYIGVDSVTLTIKDPGTGYEGVLFSCLVNYSPLRIEERSNEVEIITDMAAPGAAGVIRGKTEVCVGESIRYSVESISDARFYVWTIELPDRDSIITTTDPEVNIEWPIEDETSATLYVNGENACGSGSQSDGLTVNLYEEPTTPDKPVGDATVCGGYVESYSTSTGDSINIVSYLWKIDPETAGVFDGDSTLSEVTIIWASASQAFTADLSVASINPCDTSNFSENLMINIFTAPDPPPAPSGPDTLCIAAQNVVYETAYIPDVTYNWRIDPVVGSVIVDSNFLTISVNDTFTGTFTVFVSITDKTGSDCDTSPESDTAVFVRQELGIPAIPSGDESVCDNESTAYSSTGSTNATSYSWVLSPPVAGTLSFDGLNATVDWDKGYSGTADISIDAMNACDTISSESLLVTVNESLTAIVEIGINSNPVCDGDEASFFIDFEKTENEGDDPMYYWYRETAIVDSGSTSYSTVNYSPGDQFHVKLKSSETCLTSNPVSSNVIILEVSPKPGEKEILPKTDMGTPVVLIVCCPEDVYTYQWFENDNLLAGETDRIYYKSGGIDVDATYKVDVKNEFGCSTISTYTKKKGMAIDASELFIIYPNPSAGEITLALNDQNIPLGTNEVTMHVYDISGENVLTETLTTTINQIRLYQLNKGIYYVVLDIKNGPRQVKKLLIQ